MLRHHREHGAVGKEAQEGVDVLVSQVLHLGERRWMMEEWKVCCLDNYNNIYNIYYLRIGSCVLLSLCLFAGLRKTTG